MGLRRLRIWVLLVAAAVVLSGLLLGLRSSHLQPPRTEETDLGKADALAAVGRLKEAQDAYLHVLLNSSVRNLRAMEGLVSVRRRLAHDDPKLLRGQARAYLDAANRGVETSEHYTAESMRLVAAANLLAAVRLEASSRSAGVRSPTGRRELPAASALREEQDKDLAILLQGTRGADEAMQHLIALQRRSARDNPTLLRRQARAYLDAANRGIETPDHYSANSMRLLAAADLLAALQVEAERVAAHDRRGEGGRLRVYRGPGVAAHPAEEESGSRAAVPPAQRAPKPQPALATPGPQDGQTGGPQPQGGPVPPEKSPPGAPKRPAKPAQRRPLPSWAAIIQRPFPAKRHAPAPEAPPQAIPTVVRVESTVYGQRSGKLEAVDCVRGTFLLRDGSQRYSYTTTRGTALYLDSSRLTGDCPLLRFVGSSALVWSTGGAQTNIAGRVTVLQPSKARPPRTPDHRDPEQNRTPPAGT
jgi:hypothetical protein